MVARLRERTGPLHDTVDRAFGGHDLADAADYRAVLLAHARALPSAEAAAASAWPDLRPRLPLLHRDLDDLNVAMPAAIKCRFDTPGCWGALYVVEGSRLGGGILARGIAPELPTRYLSAVHLPGEWRAIREAIDAVAAGENRRFRDGMLAGATECFSIYMIAANSLLDRT